MISQSPKTGFLQFSQKVDYGLFLLIELARNGSGEPVSLRVIAERSRMSFSFLQKVAFELRKADLISADRGKNGGYILKKDPKTVTLKEIIEALEGPIAVMSCFSHQEGQPQCVRLGNCCMRQGLGYINQTIVNLFCQTTLHHLLFPTWKQPA